MKIKEKVLKDRVRYFQTCRNLNNLPKEERELIFAIEDKLEDRYHNLVIGLELKKGGKLKKFELDAIEIALKVGKEFGKEITLAEVGKTHVTNKFMIEKLKEQRKVDKIEVGKVIDDERWLKFTRVDKIDRPHLEINFTKTKRELKQKLGVLK